MFWAVDLDLSLRLTPSLGVGKSKEITVTALTLTSDWDKVFPRNDAVTHEKVTFRNRFGLTLAAFRYAPRDAKGRCPASPWPGLLVR